MWLLLLGAIVVSGLFLSPRDASAQFLLGAQASYASGVAEGVRPGGVGLRTAVPAGPAAWGLELAGSFDFFLPDCQQDDCRYWGINGNLVYRLPRPVVPARPYVGAGLHYRNFEREPVEGPQVEERGAGFNVIAGAEFSPGRAARPFVEARYEFMQDFRNQFVLSAGILF